MRKLIYTINLTLDRCCDRTKMVPDEEVLDTARNSSGMLTCSFMGVKPIN